MGTTSSPSRTPTSDQAAVDSAVEYSRTHLDTLKRASGESYFVHGMEVASTLKEMSQDDMLIGAALLHDLPMHPDGEQLLAKSPLNDEQRALVKGMHQLRRLHIDMNTSDLDRMVEAFADDSRLLLLRMVHRVNDIRHLKRFNTKRRREIAHETLYMYTAVSGRLGFNRWRWEMEDICFKELQPSIAKRIEERFNDTRAIDMACLQHAATFLQQKLREQHIASEIDERIKGLYSTYRKMVLKNRGFEELTDRLALRIRVPTVEDCYRALGVIHGNMRPIPGKLKDYIGTPKENGYKSIHTVVYPLPGISELPIEIQIRTHDMHTDCEFGIASHSNYKHWKYKLGSQESRANLFRNLEGLHAVMRSQRTFTEALKHSFNENKLLIFDPKNNLYHLPRQSTARDFIQHVYPERKDALMNVRINGREQTIDMPLQDGDTVEIL